MKYISIDLIFNSFKIFIIIYIMPIYIYYANFIMLFKSLRISLILIYLLWLHFRKIYLYIVGFNSLFNLVFKFL